MSTHKDYGLVQERACGALEALTRNDGMISSCLVSSSIVVSFVLFFPSSTGAILFLLYFFLPLV